MTIELDKEDLGLLVDLAGFFDLSQRGYTPREWGAWENLIEAAYVERGVDKVTIVPTIAGYERVRRIKRSGTSKKPKAKDAGGHAGEVAVDD